MNNSIFTFKENSAKSKSEIPCAGIADVQLQLYNVNPDHHHGNKCISHQLPDIRVCGNGVKPNSISDDSKKVHTCNCNLLFVTKNAQYLSNKRDV